jgi:hypothetical protein
MTAAALLEGAHMKQADVSRMLTRLADYGLVLSARPSEHSLPGRPPLLWRAAESSPAWDALHLAEHTTSFHPLAGES